jgi:hypothetical protein
VGREMSGMTTIDDGPAGSKRALKTCRLQKTGNENEPLSRYTFKFTHKSIFTLTQIRAQDGWALL